MEKFFVLLLIAICALMPLGASLTFLSLDKNFEGFFEEGTVLITEWEGNKIIEVNSNGDEIWNITGLSNPQDAERLSNGNTIVTVYSSQKVIEFDRQGNIVWQKTGLSGPVDVERLENGNTLITEFSEQRVIEIDSDLNIVWEKNNLSSPFDAERLPNGNTLIIESFPEGRLIEVDVGGDIVWSVSDLEGPVDVERLENGNTLITEHIGKRVFEIDNNSDIVWQKTGLLVPKDAERLENGNTIIAECGANRVIEVNPDGNNVWVKSDLEYPVDVELVGNQPPSIEIINPKDGYFHFSGIPLFPTIIDLISDTMSIGGFRLKPLMINAYDTSDDSKDLIVKIFINEEERGLATFDETSGLFTWQWTGWSLGNYQIKITAEDTSGATSSIEKEIWNFCFIP